MKNIKKVMALIVTVVMLASVISVSTVSVSAANTAFKDVKYVISHFDDEANTGGNGLMDPLGKPMTSVPDDSYKADLDPNVASQANEYCGTEFVSIASDADAVGGKALKIHMEPGYASYDKTKACIRKMGGKYVVSDSKKAYTYLCFYIKVHNLAYIDTDESCVEIAQTQDFNEYCVSLTAINKFLKDSGGKGLEADKWCKVEIPFNKIAARAGSGDMKVNIARVYINNGNNSQNNRFTDNPYIMIDELCIAEGEPPATSAPSTPEEEGFNVIGAGKNPSSSKEESSSNNSSSSKKPATILVDRNSSASSGTEEEEKGLTDEEIAEIVAGIADGTITDISKYTDDEKQKIKDKVASDHPDLGAVFNDDGTVTIDEGGMGWLLWVIIAAAAVILIGGGLAIFFLVVKKPAPVAEAAAATEDAPAEEAASEETDNQ